MNNSVSDDTNPFLLPLSQRQALIWAENFMQPDVPLNRSTILLAVEGELDSDTFLQAFSVLVARHEALKSTVVATANGPCYSLRTNWEDERHIEMVDLSNQSDPASSARSWIGERAEKLFHPGERLFDAALLKLETDKFIFYLNQHHVVTDGASDIVIHEDLEKIYLELISGCGPAGPRWEEQEGPPYSRFLKDSQLPTELDKTEMSTVYWQERFMMPVPPAKFYGRKAAVHGASTRRLRRHLDENTSRKIWDFGPTTRPHAVFAVVLLAFLRRITGNDDLCIGVPFHNRTNEFARTIGLIMQVTPMRFGFEKGTTFAGLLNSYAQILRDIRPHRNYAVSGRVAGYDVTLNYRTMTPKSFAGFHSEYEPTTALNLADNLTLDGDHKFDGREALTVDVEHVYEGGPFVVNLDFNKGVWPDPLECERAFDHFLELIRIFLDDSEQVIDEIQLLTPKEKKIIFPEADKYNFNSSDLPDTIDQFADQVARRPDHPAVVFDRQQLTYRELGDRVSRLSSFLRAKNVGADTMVAVCIDRSLDMVTALLAVMHAGGTYVPIDPDHPSARINQILEDADPPVLLSERALCEKLGDERQDRVYCLDDGEWMSYEADAESKRGKSGKLAYVIFTSGSTGRPKGVEVLHLGLSAFLQAMAERPGFGENDRLLAVTTVSFDIAALELFLPLVSGATVYIATHGDSLNGKALSSLMSNHDITVIQATPTTYRILIAVGWQGNPNLKILCGGEALPLNLAGLLLDRCGELWNMYGPTETTIWSVINKIESDSSQILIGTPITGTQIYVLNDCFVPVPVGVPGELCIAGAGLAQGYFNRPDLTAEKFVPNPFSDDLGARMYRTGDKARYLENGKLEFLGRLDNQIKLRGYRIELGEIETTIDRHQAIRQCVVGLYEPDGGEKALVAYIVPEEGTSGLNSNDIREYLRPQIPAYMIPSAVVCVEDFPLTPNNKIDRKLLPSPSAGDFTTNNNYVPATTVREREIVASWESLLGITPIGIEESFTSLGGDSLSFVSVSMMLEDALGHLPENWEEMPIRELAKLRKSDSLLYEVDTSIFLRAVLIVLVVVVHSKIIIIGGVFAGLFLVAGYIFANLQLKSISFRDDVKGVFNSIVKIVLPVTFFSTVLQIGTSQGKFNIAELLYYSNFLGPNASSTDAWFVQVLVQIMLITAMVLSIKSVRRFAIENSFQFGLLLLLVSVAFNYGVPLVWDTNHLFNRVPHLHFWLFALGWCVYFSDNTSKRVLTAAIALLLFSPSLMVEGSTFIVLSFTVLALLFLPQVVVFFPLNRLIYLLAGASLFIYISHPYFQQVLHRIVVVESVLLDIFVGLLGGIMFWFAWERFTSFMSRNKWLQKFRFS